MDESVVQVPCRAADTALSRLLAGRPGHESSRWHPVCPGAPERRSKYPAMYSIQKIIDLLLLLGVPSLLFIGAYVLRRPKRAQLGAGAGSASSLLEMVRLWLHFSLVCSRDDVVSNVDSYGL